MKKKMLVLVLLLLFLVSATAAVPRLLTVQGRLKESGSAVSGSYDLTFYIYNAESTGTALYTEAHTGGNSVSVSSGFFSTRLGEIVSLDLPFKEQYWLGIKVGSDAEMTPRIKLTNSSYAFVARDLNVGANLNIDSGTLYVDIANNRVGVGTISPQQVFEVVGNAVRVSGVTTPMLELYPSSGDQWRVQSQNDSSFSIFNVTDGRTYLSIDGSGNIGVEKTPSYKFDVNGIVNATQYYQGGSPLISGYWTQSGNDIYYNTGNVGIGTANPGAKLDVELSTSTNSSYGMRVDVTTVDDAAFDTIRGMLISTTINDSSDNVHSLYLYNENTAANKAPNIFLYIDQEDPEATNATGIYFYELGTMTNAIDASDSDIVNALYLGSNNIRFSSSFNITDGSNNLFTFTDQGTTGDLTVTGNVGIGTASPGAKLDVNGDARFGCRSGFWAVADGRICVETTLRGPDTAWNAIGACKVIAPGCRVCEHNDLQQACGSGVSNPYGATTGWYGDHGVTGSASTSGNWDDEFGTWNANGCANNNDGPAQPAATVLNYRCCY